MLAKGTTTKTTGKRCIRRLGCSNRPSAPCPHGHANFKAVALCPEGAKAKPANGLSKRTNGGGAAIPGPPAEPRGGLTPRVPTRARRPPGRGGAGRKRGRGCAGVLLAHWPGWLRGREEQEGSGELSRAARELTAEGWGGVRRPPGPRAPPRGGGTRGAGRGRRTHPHPTRRAALTA